MTRPRVPDMADFMVHTYHQVCGLNDVAGCAYCEFKRWLKSKPEKRVAKPRRPARKESRR